MKGFRFLKGATVGLACCGMMVPRGEALASGPQRDVQPAAQVQTIQDVALTAGGTVTGHVLDEQGNPVDGAVVIVKQGDREVANTTSDASGTFVASNLRGGVYQVYAGQGQRVFRFWAPNTAPPAAMESAVVYSTDTVVRGQNGFGGIDVITLTTVTAAVAAAILAGLCYDQASDNEDELEESRAEFRAAIAELEAALEAQAGS